jgi:hypothetical protein
MAVSLKENPWFFLLRIKFHARKNCALLDRNKESISLAFPIFPTLLASEADFYYMNAITPAAVWQLRPNPSS